MSINADWVRNQILDLQADNERLRGLLREIRRDYMVALDSFNVLRDMGVTPTERGVRMDEVRRRIARIDAALVAADQPSG